MTCCCIPQYTNSLVVRSGQVIPMDFRIQSENRKSLPSMNEKSEALTKQLPVPNLIKASMVFLCFVCSFSFQVMRAAFFGTNEIKGQAISNCIDR